MNYKKIIKDNYTLHLVDTDRFKMMNVVVFFSKKFEKNDLKYGGLLVKNLVYSSKKYNTKNKIAIIGEELYGAGVSSSFNVVGNTSEIVFSLEFLNPKYTSADYLEKSVDFLYEVLFNPNVNDGKFNEEFFNITMNEMKFSLDSIKDNPGRYASIGYAKNMYKGTASSYSSTPSKSDIEKVNPSNLFEYYKKLFDGTYRIDVIAFGENLCNIDEIIDKKFKNVISSKDDIKLSIKHKYTDEVKEIVEVLPFNQSVLYIGYRLNDLTYHELNHVLRVYNTILGTMNDSVLFNIVREENSLCYSVGSFYSKYNPSLTVYAGINKDNYEKARDLILNCVELMKDKKTLMRLFESAKKNINTFLNSYYDNATSQIDKYYFDQFDVSEDIETIREKINNVTVEEVIDLNDKISLSTIYLLKGDNNDRKDIC